MVAPTNVRAGRATALFAAFQAAKGTAASDFTAADAARLWTERDELDLGPDVLAERYMDADLGPKTGGEWFGPDGPQGALPVVGTPTSVEWLLRSNYGAYASPNFTLATGVAAARWLTLALVENRFEANSAAGRVARLRDVWVHRLDLEWAGPSGRLTATAHYAGRAVATQLQSAGGLTLPAAPMLPADRSPFPTRNTTLVRDPSGANVSLRFRRLRVTLDQGLGRDWDMGAHAWDVYKAGPLRAELEVETDVSDESWAVLDLSRSETRATYRVTSTAEDGSVLTLTLHNVGLKVSPLRRGGLEYEALRGAGIATHDGTNFVTVTLT